MVLIAGLGNPGPTYAGTRHNVGFLVAEELAARHRAVFVAGSGAWNEARFDLGDDQVVVIKPLTFMNLSGAAVAEAREARGGTDVRLLIVYDDFQLLLGSLRLRLRGSDGGHNGMCSVIESLGTTEVPRLRCGIASPHMPIDKDQLVGFVLERFAPDEADAVREMIRRAADACEAVVFRGWTAAMNEFNRPLPDVGDE
ncbi:MAG: aminoacyl-tRNA hydrolase [Bacteroidota bacterium]